MGTGDPLVSGRHVGTSSLRGMLDSRRQWGQRASGWQCPAGSHTLRLPVRDMLRASGGTRGRLEQKYQRGHPQAGMVSGGCVWLVHSRHLVVGDTVAQQSGEGGNPRIGVVSGEHTLTGSKNGALSRVASYHP
jgi:hypothetical protein